MFLPDSEVLLPASKVSIQNFLLFCSTFPSPRASKSCFFNAKEVYTNLFANHLPFFAQKVEMYTNKFSIDLLDYFQVVDS